METLHNDILASIDEYKTYLNDSARIFNIYTLIEKYKQVHVIREGEGYYSIVALLGHEEKDDKYVFDVAYGLYTVKNDWLNIERASITLFPKTIPDTLLKHVLKIINERKDKKLEVFNPYKEAEKNRLVKRFFHLLERE